jgi:hypothetical protein
MQGIWKEKQGCFIFPFSLHSPQRWADKRRKPIVPEKQPCLVVSRSEECGLKHESSFRSVSGGTRFGNIL